MKKFLLLFLSLINGFSHIKSQITLSSADFGNIGDTFLIAVDTMPSGIAAGGSGQQYWDFTALQTSKAETDVFVFPSLTPAATNFQNSSIAINHNNGTSYSYHTLSSSSYTYDGYYGNFEKFEISAKYNVRNTIIAAVADEKTSEKICITPNPSSGIFYFKSLNGDLSESELSLVNYSGENIIVETCKENQMDLSGQPSGIYLLRCKNGTKIFHSKLIKQ